MFELCTTPYVLILVALPSSHACILSCESTACDGEQLGADEEYHPPFEYPRLRGELPS